MAFRKTVDELKTSVATASDKVTASAKDGSMQIFAAIILAAVVLALGMIIAAGIRG